MHVLGLEGHASLVLWTQLAALLGLAHCLGALTRRARQPAIIGALVAGLLLGPSVFGQLWPAGFGWFLPADRGPLSTVAAVCLLVLLVVLGAETDLLLIRRLGRPAAVVTTTSIVVPLAAGLAVGALLPEEMLGDTAGRDAFALLVAGAVSVSSLPVVATIVSELGMVRRNFGQLAIAGATINDTFGFLVIAIAAALAGAGAGAGALLEPLVGLAVFVAVLAIAGQRAVDLLLREVRRAGPNVVGSLAVCLVAAFAAAAVTQGIGVDGALGAFLAGVVLGRSRFQQGQALRYLESFSTALCAPLYFATAGLQVDLTALGRTPVFASFAALLVVALVAKFGGVLVGAAAARLPLREGSALGVALNGRGALQVIIGTAGLRLGIFSGTAYTVIILMSIVSSVLVPPALRRVVRGWAGSPAERERLDREEELEQNVVVRGHRLLLPSRGSQNSAAAAAILDCAWPAESAVTVLSIGAEPDVSGVVTVLADREITRRHVASDDVIEEILAEANLGYGVIALGAAETPTADSIVAPIVAELLNRSPLPLVIVRRGRDIAGRDLPRFRRVLVPVTGTGASRAGQEVADNISRRTGAAVSVLHVLTRPGTPAAATAPRWRRGRPLAAPARTTPASTTPAATDAANAVLVEAQATSIGHDVRPETLLRQGSFAGEEVAAAARELRADLVVVGATVRRVGNHPFLGHTVEHLLEHLLGPTVVAVVLPEPASSEAAVGDAHTDRTAR